MLVYVHTVSFNGVSHISARAWCGVVPRYGKYAINQLEIYQPVVGPEMIITAPDLQLKLNDLKNDTRLKICFAGRLAPEKGLDVMFRAIAKIKDCCEFSVNLR